MILQFRATRAKNSTAPVTKREVRALRRVIALAAFCCIPLLFTLSRTEGRPPRPGRDQATQASAARTFHVVLPERILPLPEGLTAKGAAPGFKLRGMKGWAWVPSQYLAEIPIMAEYKMNFLMNCYTSMWDLEVHDTWARIPPGKPNHWYQPLPEEKKRGFERVVRECQKRGIQFCFSMNPNLSSDMPFDYNNPQDLEDLWKHYAWMQGLGVKWFNISLDDISQGIDAGGQVRMMNSILHRLREKDPEVRVIFSPTWYAGPHGEAKESSPRLGTGDTPGLRYTKELAENLDPDIYLFWTGPEVFSLTITPEDVENYRRLCRHPVFLWDNYPVNDQNPTLHLGPLTGRDPRLAKVVDGFLANSMCPQNEANRIPMLTVADYLWNPEGYDPARSIGQSIAHLARTREQRRVLGDLVELYPGRLEDSRLTSGWNSLRRHFRTILANGSPSVAQDFIKNAEGVSGRMAKLLPNQFVLARRTLDGDIAGMREEYAKKYP
jgi:hypothetical protein